MTFIDPNLLRKRGLAEQQFGLTTANLQYNKAIGNQQYAQDASTLTRNFQQMRAALPGQFQQRGLLHSGIYSEALYHHNQDRTNKFSDLVRQHGQQNVNNNFQQQTAGLQRDNTLADVDWQESQARAALAAQLRTVR